MKCKLFVSMIALVAIAAMSQSARSQGPVTVVEDFEGEFPGVQGIWGGGFSFYGGGAEIPPVNPGDPPTNRPVVTQQVLGSGGFNSNQAYQIEVDALNQAGSWGWYYGLGSFLGFYGEGYGFAQGQTGEDNPANFKVSFDLKALGNTSAAPVRGTVILYKPDYETVYGVDLNADGDMIDGFDIWSSNFTVPTAGNNYADYNHVTWNLGQGTAPTAPAPIATPQFDDEATFVIRLEFGAGEFAIDAGNIVTLDNVGLAFTPPGAGQPGDFNGSGKVNGDDFLLWQRGGSPNGLTPGDLQTWRDNYGLPLGVGAVTAIPEPTSIALVGGALAATLLVARRRKA